MVDDTQIRHRRMIVELENLRIGRVKQVGIGIKLSDTPGRILHPAPVDGRDSENHS